MAEISIWPGSSSFFPGDTPFGFYDSDTQFQSDSDKVAGWCAQRLGYPLVDIELQPINFYTCFEEAISEYGSQLYHFEIIDNFHALEGSSTGSALNTQLITPNLGSMINIADQYGNEIEWGGGNQDIKSGSLGVKPGQQKYDLLSNISSSISGSEVVDIKRIYHSAPSAISRYFDPYAGTGTGIQSLMQTFGFGNFSPGVNFMLMPMYFDLLKVQAIEMNDQIRKSAYGFEIHDDRYLKLFPIPQRETKLWFEYVVRTVANSPAQNPDQGLVTNMSNAPYNNPIYKQINEPGRQWIRRYALALAKEMLGSVRGKYQTVPIPGSDTTLDHARLVSEAKDEKVGLIEELKANLMETSRVKQLERQDQESEHIQNTFGKVPNPIYIF